MNPSVKKPINLSKSTQASGQTSRVSNTVGVFNKTSKVPANEKKSTRGTLIENVRSFYGVGRARGVQICQEFGYLPKTLYKNMSSEAVARIYAYTRGEGVLREVMSQRIKQKVKVGTYAGIRRRRGLPSRGQRTQANGSTARRLNIGRT